MSCESDVDKTPELSHLYHLKRDRHWERYFGKKSVVVDSAQRAIQISLELLNSGVKGFPVVMPVTAPPAVVGGVLRSGAVPLLLDIDKSTFNMDPSLFKEAINELGDGMVTLFCEIGGQPIPKELLDILKPYSVTILYSPTHPRNEAQAYPYTFMIKDLNKMIDKGAVIYHDYEEQLSMIYAARDGVLGHDAKLSKAQEQNLERLLDNDRVYLVDSRKADFQRISKAFKGTGVGVLWESSLYNEEFGIVVPDAQKAVAKLKEHKFMAQTLINPLHKEPMVAARYREKASYPNAEAVMNRVITVPVLDFRSTSLKLLIKLILEEYNEQEGTNRSP